MEGKMTRHNADIHNIDDLLARVREAWIKSPDLRFGQLIVGVLMPEIFCPEIFYIKDRYLRGRLEQWMTKNSETNKTG